MTVAIAKVAGTRTGGTGTAVLRITGSDPYQAKIYAQHELVLTAGTEYRITGWMRSDSTNEFEATVWTSPVDESGPDVQIVAPVGSAAWSDFDETFTPADDSYLRFGGSNDGSASSDFWFEFDDLELDDLDATPVNPVLYWTAGGGAVLTKELVEVYAGVRALAVTADPDDFSRQDVNLDERYSPVVEAFVMSDGGDGVLRSRVLDPEPPS
jgi:hypothetical protein